MKLHIVDLELNQPSGQIIQIGAVRLDVRSGAILSEFSTFVNPQEQLDPYITDLCQITQSQVDAAPTIGPALQAWWAWLDSKHLSAWGSDVDLLTKRSADLGVAIPHFVLYNLLPMGMLLRQGLVNGGRGGLLPTMRDFGLEFAGHHHNALDDARNTARLVHTWVNMLNKYTRVRGVINDQAGR